MGTRIRKALRITGWSLCSLFVLLAGFVGLLAFPGFTFAHQEQLADPGVRDTEAMRELLTDYGAGKF